MNKTERSAEILKRARAITPGGVHSPVRAFRAVGSDPFVVDRGEGPYLFDVDGNRYVDYVCSWGPLVLGHAHPAVLAAIAEQAERGLSYGASCEREVELAELIQSFMPNLEMLRFVSSGTEATMSAIRVARGFTGRDKIIKFVGCYHGHADHLLVQAGSGVLTLGIPGSPGVPKSIVQDTLSAQFNDIDSVTQILEAHPGQVAAIILEPIIGNCGLIAPLPSFLSDLRRLCDETGTLLIFDEVMTGFRAHLGGAQALYGIKPDLTTLGKVIGGGLPVGAYGGKKEIMLQVAPEGPIYQAGTLSGNPVAMAAGIATLKEWGKAGVFEESAALATTIRQAFAEMAQTSAIPLTASSIGTMFGFFFRVGPVEFVAQAKQSDTERFTKFFQLCLERGVYFAPSQFEAGFVSSAHKGEAIDHTIRALQEVFTKL